MTKLCFTLRLLINKYLQLDSVGADADPAGSPYWSTYYSAYHNIFIIILANPFKSYYYIFLFKLAK